MDELRNNDDRLRASDPADSESSRSTATETGAGDESGVETIARIPLSRSVIIDERQQPLPSSESLLPSHATSAAIPAAIPRTASTQAGAEAATDPVPAAAKQAAPETGARRPNSASAPPAEAAAVQPTVALFPEGDLQTFRGRWDQVQASFVDDPRRAVQDADNLVASMVKRIAEQFAEQRAKLESQWSQGDDATTEELRRGLRQYRAFFERLLSM
jgi:hypothetical protein